MRENVVGKYVDAILAGDAGAAAWLHGCETIVGGDSPEMIARALVALLLRVQELEVRLAALAPLT